MASLLCKFAVVAVLAVQAFALCHAGMGRVSLTSDNTAARGERAVAVCIFKDSPSCSTGSFETAKPCNSHFLPDGRHTIVPPAEFLPVALIGFDPTEFRAHSFRSFIDVPTLSPSARLSLPLLI